MAATELREEDLKRLQALDTPTVCNALELVAPERRATGFTTEPLVCARPELPAIVGYARTVTIRAKEPDARSPAGHDRMAYYAYVASGPRPGICVIEDLDGAQVGFGAFWGEVHTNVHRGLGCAGVVTNGSIRDLDELAEGFQLLAGSVGPSHAHVHVVDFGGEVSVANMVVASGELIHADRHGAVVIPIEVARDIPRAAELVARREAPIIEASRRPDFDLGKLRAAMREAAEIH
ncbi:MAG: RraA family protein [Myxococcota bacterium]